MMVTQCALKAMIPREAAKNFLVARPLELSGQIFSEFFFELQKKLFFFSAPAFTPLLVAGPIKKEQFFAASLIYITPHVLILNYHLFKYIFHLVVQVNTNSIYIEKQTVSNVYKVTPKNLFIYFKIPKKNNYNIIFCKIKPFMNKDKLSIGTNVICKIGKRPIEKQTGHQTNTTETIQ